MPGYLLTEASQLLCAHMGTAKPSGMSLSVTVDGSPVVSLNTPYSVSGCPFVYPAPGPCMTAQWVVGATRVTSYGVALLLQDSVAICLPTGSGLQPAQVQSSVSGI